MGGIYKNEAASAFGIFKFVQSGGSALAFLYSPVLGFHLQVMMMMMMIIIMMMMMMMIMMMIIIINSNNDSHNVVE